MRRILGGLIVLAGILVGLASVSAQTYPTHPITLVVPFPAGSTTDLVGRILADRLGDALGQRVVIDNRGGAGGVVGSEAVMRAEPDGYTLLMGTIGTHAINPYVYPKIAYDPVQDFSPIIQFGTAPNVLVVHPSLPVKTVKELIEYVRARPGQTNYASSGNGTSNHLSGAMFAAREGLKASHVPYRGGVVCRLRSRQNAARIGRETQHHDRRHHEIGGDPQEPDRAGHRPGLRYAARSARIDEVRNGALATGCRTGRGEAVAVILALDGAETIIPRIFFSADISGTESGAGAFIR